MVRPRALSESDAVGLRGLFRSVQTGTGNARRRRGHHGAMEQTTAPAPRNLSSSATVAIQIPSSSDLFSPTRVRSVTDGGLDSFTHLDSLLISGTPEEGSHSSVSTDPSEAMVVGDNERRARARWIQINRRFQYVITAVALLFSLLLFGILICWVVLTSAYVLSIEKSCDVPLKRYYWLVTIQLVLDVFRTDIMRFVFDWDSSSNERIPLRVIIYNVSYLIFASLVLRLGTRSVFAESDADCRDTAPELFNASMAFVSLSLAAWATIICGYLLPFLVVAALLTYNGYDPSAAAEQMGSGNTPVFPAAYATTGAPTGTIDLLPVLPVEEFPADYPSECCICMEPFAKENVVETSCKHVFHKECCREWLRQARSCPVCRTDIPAAYENSIPADQRPLLNGTHNSGDAGQRIPLGPTGRPVVGLWRVIHSRSISFGASAPETQGRAV